MSVSFPMTAPPSRPHARRRCPTGGVALTAGPRAICPRPPRAHPDPHQESGVFTARTAVRAQPAPGERLRAPAQDRRDAALRSFGAWFRGADARLCHDNRACEQRSLISARPHAAATAARRCAVASARNVRSVRREIRLDDHRREPVVRVGDGRHRPSLRRPPASGCSPVTMPARRPNPCEGTVEGTQRRSRRAAPSASRVRFSDRRRAGFSDGLAAEMLIAT